MIPEFCLRLICGLSTMWCLAPRRLITSGFFRIQMLLALGLSVLSAVTVNQLRLSAFSDPDLFQSFEFAISLCLACLTFAGSIAWTLERRRGGTLFAWAILLTSLTGIVLAALGNADGAAGLFHGSPALRIGNSLTAAWSLGATTAAMLLGHWYLTATGMSLIPLKQYTWLFGGAVLLRMLAVAALQFLSPETVSGNWTLLTLRWAGLVGPLILAGLTLQILRFRNTQSATGVLYAATILVFMGEMAAALSHSAHA